MLEDLKKIKSRVETILETYPITRNSDTELLIHYAVHWHCLNLNDLRHLPCAFETIRRSRQAIQEEGKFQASNKVAEARKKEADAVRDHFREKRKNNGEMFDSVNGEF